MKRWFLAVIMTAAVAVPLRARAQVPTCASLPNPIYVQAGDTQQNLLLRLGRALRDNTARPVTLVYFLTGSCTNIDAIYHQVPQKMNMSYVPSVAEDPNWNPASSPALTCTVPTEGVLLDIANSALFNSACPNAGTPPATVHLTQGPTQAYVMAVPVASSETAITFEEAYFVFGFGAAGMIKPWIDELQMFIRTATKSTLLAWARNISVPESQWKGKPFDKSSDVVVNLKNQNPSALGILGAEVYDANRNTLKALAYRAKGQYAAYYPDSSASARDKKNVRDGHYTVWSPTIWMDNVDGTGTPVKADTRYVVDLIAGNDVTPAANFSMIDIIAGVGLVPACAMAVNREFEGGPLKAFTPPESCVCKYDSLVGLPPSCVPCTTTCAAGVCRNGYCEVR